MHENTGNASQTPYVGPAFQPVGDRLESLSHKGRTLPGMVISLLLTGCGLTGTWRTVAVSPKQERPPFSVVTFGRDHYTATTARDGLLWDRLSSRSHIPGNPVTSTGTYTWNGRKLTMVPIDGPQRVYRGRRRIDRKLVLVHRRHLPGGSGRQEITTILEKVRNE